MWQRYNNNPMERSVGDCAVRAVSVVLGLDWEAAFSLLCKNAYLMGDMPSSNAVMAATLRQKGFYRQTVPDACPDCYTAEDFCEDYPHGTYVLGFGGHVAAVKDGIIYDSWDSSKEIPQYFFYKKEGY